MRVDRYFVNTVVVAFGSWSSQIIVATTAGFALSVLRPALRQADQGLVLTTLFVPVVVLLVPLYIEIVHPPLIHHSFIDSYWAVWLPAGASAFNVVLMTRFFDNLPREIFEAAKVDGAAGFRLFWSVVLPMSRPILGVVSVFAILASWKDFLWPLLVLTNPDEQPLSVRLPRSRPRPSSACSSRRSSSPRSCRSSASSSSSARSCAAADSAARSRAEDHPIG